MALPHPRSDLEQVRQLLEDYSFESGDVNVDAVIENWLRLFDLNWIHNAIVEALYQGRYKVISIDHILQFWQKRGTPLRHFTREFESIIVGDTPFRQGAFPPPNPPIAVEPQPQEVPPARSEALEQPDQPADQQTANLPTNPFIAPVLEAPWPQPAEEPAAPPPAPLLLTAEDTGHPKPICTFVPKEQPSGMHHRLQAVAKRVSSA